MNNRQIAAKVVVWGLLLALVHLALNLKHPLMYTYRSLETPVLLICGVLGLLLTWRSIKQGLPRWQKLEKYLQLLGFTTLLTLTLGQESWFRWQQHKVLAATPIMQDLGRHFIVGFRSFEEVRPLAEKGIIGGIYLKRANVKDMTPEEVRREIDQLQQIRRNAGHPPLFVAADQEGGQVSHLSPLLAPLPPLSSLLESGPSETLSERAQHYGSQQGEALASIGINLNLSPVVDLKPKTKGSWKDKRTLIGQRAISDNPDTVTQIAGAYSIGLAQSGIQPTLKHFPGLGRVQGDTHLVKASLELSPEQLTADWQPFKEISRDTNAAIMLAHVHLPGIDPRYPVSQSRTIVQELLRKQWGYTGLLITDDLNMGAAYQDGIGNAASAALDAGVDLILVTYDPDQYYRALYGASQRWRQGGINSLREVKSNIRITNYWKNKSDTWITAATMLESATLPK